MEWNEQLYEYESYLLLEKKLSANSIEAYLRDVRQFRAFLLQTGDKRIDAIAREDIEAFIVHNYNKGGKRNSQARVLSGIKSFFNYLYVYDKIPQPPTNLIDSPKITRQLPDVLSIEEIDTILSSIDLSHPTGHRNKAIIEVLYGCGLRVSELTSLRVNDCFFTKSYIRVVGKGDKQRLVPINQSAIKAVESYLEQHRLIISNHKNNESLFLNSRGGTLSRVMIFNIIKEAVGRCGICKNVSPHTLRHSFATHLIKAGANIRLVQEMLGHESILTTEIYTHLDSEFKHSVIDRFHPLSEKNKKFGL